MDVDDHEVIQTALDNVVTHLALRQVAADRIKWRKRCLKGVWRVAWASARSVTRAAGSSTWPHLR